MTAALQRATLSVALPTLVLVAVEPAISNGSRALAQPSPPAAATREAAVLSFINISSDPTDDWIRTEERRGGKECRSRWGPYH